MVYRALWDRRHSGATRIRQCTRRYAPRALTDPRGPFVPPPIGSHNARYIMLKSLSITKHSHIHLNNHVKYASWNKWLLVRDLKMSRDGDRLMLRGRSFHSIGAAAAKDLLPKFPNRHRGDVSWWFSLDRRVCVGEYQCCITSTERAVDVGTQVRVHSEPCK